MKLTKLFIFILVLFVSSNIWSAENNAFKDFQLAHQYYKNNQFKEAQTSYEQLLHRGYETSDLHYNLGNVYFRLNYIGLSILQYEKALKLNPNNEDAAFNLKIANLKVVSKIKPMFDFILVKWYKKLIQWKSVRQWAYGQILFAFIVLLSGILFIFSSSSRFKKIAFYLGIFSIRKPSSLNRHRKTGNGARQSRQRACKNASLPTCRKG